MRFRRLKCAGNVARRSGSVNLADRLRSRIWTARFSTILGPFFNHEVPAGAASDRIVYGWIIFAMFAAQIFETIPNHADE
jgi:hypothetical protein